MVDALDVSEALSVAITSKNAAAVRDLYTDDVVVWHSYDQSEQDVSATIGFLEDYFEAAEEIRYSDVRRVRTDEGYVQQHVIHTTLKTGETFQPRPVCIVAKVRDGKVYRVDEYLEARRVES